MYRAGHLSVLEINISQLHTSFNAIMEASYLCYDHATASKRPWIVLGSQREMGALVVIVHAPIYFFVFHLYKQSSSVRRATLEN
jgi:hypothetical protein